MPRRKLPTAPTEGKEDEPERVALLVSGDGGIDMAVEPAAEDKNELEEDRKEEGGEERVKDPAIQLPTVNVVESSIEIDNIRR